MNGRRGQIGDVNGQTGTRVIRWHRGHRAAWEDRLLAAGTRPDCLSGQMFRWCECEGGSDGPGELSYALWEHGGRARRPPDGPDGLGARGAKFPGSGKGLRLNPFTTRTLQNMRTVAVGTVQPPPRASPWVPEVMAGLPGTAVMSSTIVSADSERVCAIGTDFCRREGSRPTSSEMTLTNGKP